jgi:DNA-binding Lrp family transcriptional regulator
MLRIDRLDGEMIALLERDARLGIGDLADRLGVSRNTVQSRLRRLSEAGLLRGFTPRLNLVEVGITVEAFAALALDQGKLDEVIELLAGIPEVLEVHATSGREDLLVRLGTTSHAELQDLIQRIVALPGVGHSNTTLALTTPLPYRVSPLLTKATRNAGWGRSTALPEPRTDAATTAR